MKKLLPLLATLAIALPFLYLAHRAAAADKPRSESPPITDGTAKFQRPAGSDVGRYQIVVTGQPYPMVLKLDSATGACWEYQAGEVDNKHLNRKFTAHGWIPVPEDFSIELKRTMDVGKP